MMLDNILEMDEGKPQTSPPVRDMGVNDLISNLDHDIVEIRMRALQCIQRKLDNGLVPIHALCKRIDVVNRLTSWLRSPSRTEEELVLVIQFLSQLCQHEEFCRIFINTPLESLLSEAKLVVRENTRALIEALLDSSRSFDILVQDQPVSGDTNMSSQTPPLFSSRSSAIISHREKEISPRMSYDLEIKNKLSSQTTKSKGNLPLDEFNVYFKNSLPKLIPDGGIGTVRLDVSDRRVLASTVESLLSRNERLVYLTTCFVRDVLLDDFPAETFIQECSISQGLVGVVSEDWEDSVLNYSSFQALFKLSKCLRIRFAILDSSEFYSSGHQYSIHRPKSTTLTTTSRNYQPFLSRTSTDYFLSNLCQLLHAISVALRKTKSVYLWILLETFAYTLSVCVQTFNFDSTLVSTQIEEILLDLCQFLQENPRASKTGVGSLFNRIEFDRSWRSEEKIMKMQSNVPLQIISLVMTSLLNSLEDRFILSIRIRDGLWVLALDPELNQTYPSVLNYLLKTATKFEPKLDQINSTFNQVSQSVSEIDESSEGDRLKEEKFDPVTKAYFAIQNATDHTNVFQGLEKLWELTVPLNMNKRTDDGVPELLLHEDICETALTRFLSIQPTCSQDEDLLCRILDLLEYFLTFTRNRTGFKWALSFVKTGSAVWKTLQTCDSNSEDGTHTTMRSAFSFYSVIAFDLKWMSGDNLWEMMGALTEILYRLSIQEFTAPAVLQAVLISLANLTSETFILKKLKDNEEYSRKLLSLLSDALCVIGTRANQLSHRNSGSIYYLALNVLHVTLCLKNSFEWIRPTSQILPFLLASTDSRVKAIGFQVCKVMTESRSGAMLLFSEIPGPSLWENCYKHLMDFEEISLVRQQAGGVLVNLISCWNDLEMEFPKMKILCDMMRLLPNIYWHSKLSLYCKGDSEGSGDDQNQGNLGPSPPLITPKLLICITRIITSCIRRPNPSNEVQSEDNVILRETCIMLFRLIGFHPLLAAVRTTWVESCDCINNLIKTILVLIQSCPKLSNVLVADKTITYIFKIFEAEESACTKELSFPDLWTNIFNLFALCNEGSPDLEFNRLILSQRSIIFPIASKGLSEKDFNCRKASLCFLNTFLRTSNEIGEDVRKVCEDDKNMNNICQSLKNLQNSLNLEERCASMLCCQSMSAILPATKTLLTDSVRNRISSLFDFGNELLNSNNLNNKGAKCKEIICAIQLLSSIFYECEEAREIAMKNELPTALHVIFKYSTNMKPLQVAIIECLINFTDGFPIGSHSLTLTTGLGMPPRKIPTVNSLFIDVLCLLHKELEDRGDKNMNVKDMLFSLLKNCVFSNVCRNCLVKVNILSFIKRLHLCEKTWSKSMKQLFLKFVLDLSVHPDMQLFIAKLPEAIDILILLAEHESSPVALQVLRNLCFHPGNRPRFLNDPRFIPFLAERLRSSDNNQEVECIGVTLWAAIANSEKGKVVAKKAFTGACLDHALQKLKNNLNNKQLDESLIALLEKLLSILNSTADS